MSEGEATMAAPPYVDQVCRIGQGAECCRYLVVSGKGFECVKLTEDKVYIDFRVFMGNFTSRGDNCEGKIGVLDDLTVPP